MRTRRTVALVAVVLMQVAIVAGVVARSPLASFVVLMSSVLGWVLADELSTHDMGR